LVALEKRERHIYESVKIIMSRMLTYTLTGNTQIILLYFVLALAIAALAAELMPEVKAKTIVIPALIVMITLSGAELRRIYKSRRNARPNSVKKL
jgi:hypothetical protein